MRNITSKNVIKSLQAGVFNSFSSCEKIITDNGSCFRSVEYKNFMFKLGIEHRRITSFKPSGNKSERCLREVKNQIRCYFNKKQSVGYRIELYSNLP